MDRSITKSTTEKKMKMEKTQKFLPSEITTDILSRLPMKSLIQCSRVCKTWQTLIQDPQFIEIHSTNSSSAVVAAESSGDFFLMGRPHNKTGGESDGVLHYVEYINNSKKGAAGTTDDQYYKVSLPLDHFIHHSSKLFPLMKNKNPNDLSRVIQNKWVLVGSSNGLICLCERRELYRIYYICNPFTREYVNLTVDYTKAHFVVSGFGYDPSMEVYKVVRIDYNHNFYYEPYGKVKVYTLGKGIWKEKQVVPFVLYGTTIPCVLVNRALHWITKVNEIVSFDLADEEFRIVPLPPLYKTCLLKERNVPFTTPASYNPCFELVEFGGCLCLSEWIFIRETFSGREDDYSNIWVMNKYMNKESWTKKFTIQPQVSEGSHRTFLPLSKDGTVFWHRWCGTKNDKNEFRGYDLKSGRVNRFFNQHLAKYEYDEIHIVPYMMSFVSLKALGEQDAKIY